MADACGKFSDDGSRYCGLQGGGGGRARVWSLKGGAPQLEITPDAHLAAPLSCFAWLRLQRQTDRRWKGRKRKSSRNGALEDEDESDASTHIAFGTTSGKILVYSLAEAKFETTLEDRQSGPSERIVCVDWNAKCGLYSCSSDSTVREWSVSENGVRSKFNAEKKRKISQPTATTAIKLIPNVKDGYYNKSKLMLTAAYQLRLWCLDSKTVLRTMVGHSNEVCLLDVVCFPQESKLYAISGSKNDRVLSFWALNVTGEELEATDDGDEPELSEESKHRKKNSRRKSKGESAEIINIPNCNFLMEDIARQVSCAAVAKFQNTIKLCATTRSGVIHYYEHTLNGLLSKPLKPNTTIQVATEDKDGSVRPSPIVCCVLNKDSTLEIGYSLGFGMIFEQLVPNLSEKMHVLIRSLKEEDKSIKQKNSRTAETATKIKLADSKDSSVIFLSSRMSQGDQKDLKRSISGKQGDVPMESRLANLSLAQTGNKLSSDNNNLAQLLVQALHSKDNKLLQTVFECNDPEIAYSSINRLPIQYVSPLLDHLIEMLGGKTNQCRSACIWAGALCKAKSSTLLALSSSGSEKVKELRGALAARLPSLPDLLALRGRLALALHKSAENSNIPVVQTPLLDYKDSSSEDEMDDAIINNADDDSETWNEDDDDEDEADNSSKMSDEDMSDDEDKSSEDE